MACIFSLPNELIDLTSTFLTNGDVESLTRTCRELYDDALPMLYRAITLQCEARTVNDHPTIICLLRSFVGRPDLTKLVRNITVCGTARFEWTLSVASIKLLHSILYRLDLKRPIHSIMLEKAECLHIECFFTLLYDPSSVTALLVAQCTQIRTLSIPAVFLTNDRWFLILLQGQLSTSLATSHSPFDHLKSLTVKHDEKSIMVPPHLAEFLSSFSALPDLSTLDLSSMAACYRGTLHTNPSCLVLNVAEKLTALHLRRTELPASTVRQMLQCSPRLRSLTYDYIYTSIELDLDELRAGLGYVKSTLEDLTVYINVFSCTDVHGNRNFFLRGRLGSLGFLTALRKLSTSTPLLLYNLKSCSYDISTMLPLRLEQLIIQNEWDLTEDAFHYHGLGSCTTFANFARVLVSSFLQGDRCRTPTFNVIMPHLRSVAFDTRVRRIEIDVVKLRHCLEAGRPISEDVVVIPCVS